jgi:preprotein translocase subunit SecY
VLSAYVNAFRTPDLRKKLLFVLLVIVIFRIGLADPRTGRERPQRARLHQRTATDNGIYNLINLLRRRAARS